MTNPPSSQPNPLNYRNRGAAGDSNEPPSERSFWAGLIIGSFVSFVAWWFGAPAFDHSAHRHLMGVDLGPVFFYSIPITKVLASIMLIANRRLHRAGVGVLLSIPIGALIFVGSCFAHFRI